MNDFSQKLKLTERSVATAKSSTKLSSKGTPCAKYFLDTELRGFGLSVNPGGTKSYFVMRRVQNKQERHVFAKVHKFTVDEARKEAAKLLTQMDDGISLNQQKKAQKAASQVAPVSPGGITLDQAMDLCEGTLRAKGRSERTIEGYRYFIKTYLGTWGSRPLVEITHAEALQRHGDIVKEIVRGKYGRNRTGPDAGKLTANQAMRAFRAVYNRARRQDRKNLTDNPVNNVDFFAEKRRTRRIPADDLGKWYEGVMAITNTVRRDYLLFALFTGLRRTNAAEVEWAHVDFEKRSLHVPRPKSQKPFDLPLSDFLIELLRRREKENPVLAPDSIYVFPAARGEGHIAEVRMEGGAARKNKKARNVEPGNAAAVQDYSPHDLRRTFITVATSLGVPREVRQLLVC